LSIALVDEPGAWVLRVRDDGVGIAIETANHTTSLGLLGMTERAEAIGGTFSVARHPDGGTVATVTVPHPSVEGGGHAARFDR
jgi:signal transduction histidine kinase